MDIDTGDPAGPLSRSNKVQRTAVRNETYPSAVGEPQVRDALNAQTVQ